jgi:hypothetical protein
VRPVVICFFSFLLSISTGHVCNGFTRKDNWDFWGNDIGDATYQIPDYESCCAECQATPMCRVFTYFPPSNACYLKTSVGEGGRRHGGRIAGYASEYFFQQKGCFCTKR